ncbi:MAG: prolyl oligopeptidase family serine peptidase, partial [Candidatus Pacearchaeota archaeon]
YEDFNYGNYSITFYCQNANGTGTLTDNFQFKRSYVISDHYYTNSQGLKIYFDFGFNYSAEKGPLVIIPDSWTAVKDASWVTDAENYYISRGYTAAPIDTRGKGSSEGTKDAFGWECLDIYELVQHLISTSPYNSYINSSSIYIAGASGAGGKAGVCTGKYPDTFSAGYSSVGVLNLTLWWQTAGAADVAEIVARVGCNPNQCPEAYLARDASYLGYNTQSAMKAKSNADDDRVTVNCSRNYNISLINYGKTINYTENPTGGHTADFTHSSEWFIAHSNLVFIPISGDLRIGGYVHTKNFSIYLNEIKVNHTAFVDYNISGNSRIFNITTLGFNGTAEINIFDLESSTNYSINENDSLRYLLSDSNGDIEFNVTLSNYTSEIINVSKVVASSPPYCGDGSCNNGETCSSCSADCGSCGGSGGGGGGGGAHRKTNVTANITQPKIENAGVYFESIPSMIVNPGENKKIVLNIRNIGEIFLNSCKLKGTGERASWVSSDAVKDLSPGQNSEFTFNLAVPQNIKAGKYEIGLSLECQELKQSTTINAEVIEKKLGLELLKAERKDNNLIASYSLSELAGQRQEVNVEIILIGEDGKRLASLSEKKAIAPGSRNKFESAIDISKISAGSFYIVINANSEIASASLKEEVVLNKGKISGFVSLTGEEVSNIAITALVIAFAVFAFFAVRRIVKLSGIHKRKNVISAIIAGIRYYDAPDLNAPHHQHAPHQN